MRNRKRTYNNKDIYFYYEKSSGIMEVRVFNGDNGEIIDSLTKKGYHGILDYYSDNGNFKDIG